MVNNLSKQDDYTTTAKAFSGRFLQKIVLLRGASFERLELELPYNAHLWGDNGIGKTSLLRLLLFFYNPDTRQLGLRQHQKDFQTFYFSEPNSYLLFEVHHERQPFHIWVYQSQGKIQIRFIASACIISTYQANIQKNHTPSEVLDYWKNCGVFVSSSIESPAQYRRVLYGIEKSKQWQNFALLTPIKPPKTSSLLLLTRALKNVFLGAKLETNYFKNALVNTLIAQNKSLKISTLQQELKAFGGQWQAYQFFQGKTPLMKEIIEKFRASETLEKQLYAYAKTLEKKRKDIQKNLKQVEILMQEKKKALQEKTNLYQTQAQNFLEQRDILQQKIGVEQEKLQKILLLKERLSPEIVQLKGQENQPENIPAFQKEWEEIRNNIQFLQQDLGQLSLPKDEKSTLEILQQEIQRYKEQLMPLEIQKVAQEKNLQYAEAIYKLREKEARREFEQERKKFQDKEQELSIAVNRLKMKLKDYEGSWLEKLENSKNEFLGKYVAILQEKILLNPKPTIKIGEEEFIWEKLLYSWENLEEVQKIPIKQSYEQQLEEAQLKRKHNQLNFETAKTKFQNTQKNLKELYAQQVEKLTLEGEILKENYAETEKKLLEAQQALDKIKEESFIQKIEIQENMLKKLDEQQKKLDELWKKALGMHVQGFSQEHWEYLYVEKEYLQHEETIQKNLEYLQKQATFLENQFKKNQQNQENFIQNAKKELQEMQITYLQEKQQIEQDFDKRFRKSYLYQQYQKWLRNEVKSNNVTLSLPELIQKIQNLYHEFQQNFKTLQNQVQNILQNAPEGLNFPKNVLENETMLFDFIKTALYPFWKRQQMEKQILTLDSKTEKTLQKLILYSQQYWKELQNITKVIPHLNEILKRGEIVKAIDSIEIRYTEKKELLTELLEGFRKLENYTFENGQLDLYHKEALQEQNVISPFMVMGKFWEWLQNTTQTQISIEDLFEIEMRIVENQQDTGWQKQLTQVGSVGTDLLVKYMLYLTLLHWVQQPLLAENKAYALQALLDDVGRLSVENLENILLFANSLNIRLLSASPNAIISLENLPNIVLEKS